MHSFSLSFSMFVACLNMYGFLEGGGEEDREKLAWPTRHGSERERENAQNLVIHFVLLTFPGGL